MLSPSELPDSQQEKPDFKVEPKIIIEANYPRGSWLFFMYILLIAYLTGFAFAFIMQRTEVAAEKTPYTFGIRLLIIATSLLSWLMVGIMLVRTWINYIKDFGYWDELVEPGPLPTKEQLKAQTN